MIRIPTPPPPPGTVLSWGFVFGKGVRAAVGTGPEGSSRLFSPRVIVDVPASLAPAQGCVVAVVDAARVVAKGVQLIHGASFRVTDDQILQSELCPALTLPSPAWSSPGPSLSDSPALSLAKSPRLSRCSGKSTPTELFLIGKGNGNPLQCSWLENPRDARILLVTAPVSPGPSQAED